MAKNETVWSQMPYNKLYLMNLHEQLEKFYDHYVSMSSGTNKNAVASDLKDIGGICRQMMTESNELIKSLGLEGQF